MFKKIIKWCEAQHKDFFLVGIVLLALVLGCEVMVIKIADKIVNSHLNATMNK